jgi:hypothetical protein
MRSVFPAAVFTLFLVLLPGAAASAPATRPAASRAMPPGVRMTDFRIGQCLDLAVELQKLEPEARAARLRELAGEPRQGYTFFALCRMLFDAKEKGTFHRAKLGGPIFIDQGTMQDWPLEPITLYEGMPILVTIGFRLGGSPESQESYLKYCLEDCRWRDVKFAHMEPDDIQKKVEAILAAHPKVTPFGADFVRAQAG